jgi:hypothetical protein
MLPPHPDGYVRAHLSTKGTTRAGLFVVPAGEEKSQTIHLLSNPNQLLGAGDRAKSAAFASFAINFNLSHGERALGQFIDSESMI